MKMIDLNSDIGESFGAWTMGNDEGVLDAVSSANVACGFHAGDPLVMLKTVDLCAKKNRAIGAHHGYPDLVGFGRRTMTCSAEEVYADCLYQIAALGGMCKAKGMALQHVKPHGALYNQAAQDPVLAGAIARAVHDYDPKLILLGLANSCFETAAKEVGILFAAEAFADRGYRPDGSLVPRKQPGAIIHDVEQAAKRVVRMALEGKVECADGTVIDFQPHSICFHGDTPEAVEMAQAAKKALLAAGVAVKPLREMF